MTYEEIKKEIEADNYSEQDFWYWFLSQNQMDMDTKVHILDWFMSEHYPIENIASYMKEIGAIT